MQDSSEKRAEIFNPAARNNQQRKNEAGQAGRRGFRPLFSGRFGLCQLVSLTLQALTFRRTLMAKVADVLRICQENGVFGNIDRVIPHPLETADHKNEMKDLLHLPGLTIHELGEFTDDMAMRLIEFPIPRIERHRQFRVPLA